MTDPVCQKTGCGSLRVIQRGDFWWCRDHGPHSVGCRCDKCVTYLEPGNRPAPTDDETEEQLLRRRASELLAVLSRDHRSIFDSFNDTRSAWKNLQAALLLKAGPTTESSLTKAVREFLDQSSDSGSKPGDVFSTGELKEALAQAETATNFSAAAVAFGSTREEALEHARQQLAELDAKRAGLMAILHAQPTETGLPSMLGIGSSWWHVNGHAYLSTPSVAVERANCDNCGAQFGERFTQRCPRSKYKAEPAPQGAPAERCGEATIPERGLIGACVLPAGHAGLHSLSALAAPQGAPQWREAVGFCADCALLDIGEFCGKPGCPHRKNSGEVVK